MMKVGVSSYSFMQAVLDGRIDQYEAVDRAAALGFTAIDFAVLVIPKDTPMEAAKKLRKRAQDAGITVQNYAVSSDFLSDGVDATVEKLKQELQVAAEMGAPTFRHDATQGFRTKGGPLTPFAQALPELADGYRRVTEYAHTLGIKTMIENHGFYTQDSWRIEALIEAVGHSNFGTLLDIGNYLCADESPLDAIARTAPYAFHVHAKDFHKKPCGTPSPGKGWFASRSGVPLRGAIVGHGDVPVPEALKMLHNYGYDGIVAIEFEGIEDCFMAVEEGKKNLEKWITALG